MRQIPSCSRHLTERCCSMQKCATNCAHSLRKLCKLFGSLPGYGDKYIEILSSQKNNYRIVRAKGKVLKSFYRRGIFPKPEEECSTSCFLLELNCCTTVASSLRFLAWFKQCWDMSRLAWGGGGCQLTSPRQTAGGGFNFNIEKLASTFSRQHSCTWEYTYSTYV
jgi:hypothetical protein